VKPTAGKQAASGRITARSARKEPHCAWNRTPCFSGAFPLKFASQNGAQFCRRGNISRHIKPIDKIRHDLVS